MSKKILGKGLKIAGIAALVVGVVATGGALAAGVPLFGVTGALSLGFAGTTFGGLIAGGLIAAQLGGGLLATRKAAIAARSARAQNLLAQVVPNSPAIWLFGETAMPLQVVYAETIQEKRVLQILAGTAHEIDSISTMHIDDELVTFSGNAATGDWAGSLNRQVRLGTETQLAVSVAGSALPASARGRGFAYFALEWLLDGKKIKERIPTRITLVAKGAKVYDPRLDSTVGGSGTQRANDQTTWAYANVNGDVGANWALVILWYLIGWRINGKLAVGKGVDPLDIDFASFITMANVCDALVDGKPRYHIGGLQFIDGNHERTLSELEATIGGRIAKSGGIWTIWAPHDDLTPILTIGADDLVRSTGVQFQPGTDIEELFNTATGKFTDPDLLYQLEEYPDVEEAAALAEDGAPRIMNFDTVFIQDVDRAQRIARQQIRRSRFGETFQIATTWKFFNLTIFDVINLNILETGNVDKIVRVLERTISSQGIIAWTLIEEDASIYDVTDDLIVGPSRVAPVTFDAREPIELTGLTAVAISVAGTSGTASDGAKITWTDPGPLVVRTEVEFRVDGDTDFTPAPPKTLDVATAIIVPLEPGTLYDVRVRHITFAGVPGAFIATTVTPGSTATALTADNVPFDNVTGANKPEDNAQLNQPTQNLLGPDAGPEHIVATFFEYDGFEIATPMPISVLGWVAGVTRISFGGTARLLTTGTDTVLFAVVFKDSGGGTVGVAVTDSTSDTVDTPLKAEDFLVPAGTEDIEFRGSGSGGTVQHSYSKAQLHIGTKLFNFVEPPLRAERETADDLGDGEAKRITTLDEATGAARGFGALNSSVLIADGVFFNEATGGRRITRGVARSNGVDGQSFTFTPARDEIPVIRILGGGKEVPDPVGSIDGTFYERRIVALNATTAGFDLLARFEVVTGGTPTTVVDVGATSDGTGLVIEKTVADEAFDDRYTYQFDLTVNAGVSGPEPEPSAVTLAFDTRTILAGAFTERASKTFINNTGSAISFLNETIQKTIDGLGVDAAWRVRVKATAGNGGTLDAFDSVTYDTPGSQTTATETITPAEASPIELEVLSGEEGTIS